MKIQKVLDRVKEQLKDYQWEIYYLETKKLRSESKDLDIDVLTSSDEIGYSLRVLKNNSQGFAYSSSFEDDDILETIQKAKELAEISSPDEANGFVEEKVDVEKLEYFDTFGVKTDPLTKALNAVELEKITKSLDGRIKRTRNSSFSETVFETGIFNSNGIEIVEKGTVYSAMIAAVAEENGDSQISWSYGASRFLEDLNLEEIAREAVYNAVNLLNAVVIKTKEMPVLLSPYISASFLSTFSSAFSGDSLIKGKTLFEGKEGLKLTSELISIIDDGRYPKGIGTSTYDDEGTPTQKTPLIENGIFKGFLHNIYTAKKLGTKSTGNGSRAGFRSLPSVGSSNLFIQNGNNDISEVLKEYDELFYVTDVMGLHTADPISGEFSVGASGILFSKGEIVHGVRGVTIADNYLNLLDKVCAVGNDLKFYGSVGSPSVLVEKVMVAGK